MFHMKRRTHLSVCLLCMHAYHMLGKTRVRLRMCISDENRIKSSSCSSSSYPSSSPFLTSSFMMLVVPVVVVVVVMVA